VNGPGASPASVAADLPFVYTFGPQVGRWDADNVRTSSVVVM